MKNKNHKKLIVASALIAGATIGGAAITSNQMANATSNNNDQVESSELHERPELSEEEKAEIKAKLDAMTEEERQEWLESHKPKDGERPELPDFENGERPEKPADLTDEEWEQKKAELKEKLDAMTDEERKEWLENHKPKGANPPELGERPDFSESGEHPELPDFENSERPTDLSSEAPSEE